ncbi:MAG: short-chain dehydrogenase [Armatimonadetes bacterium CG07_land_8_20_14_0_80_40_9]|nr:MAG: short-chain dehydrogenase [Armatimonadetes bacterium CG07_land_8_20_14_0_80_40_9]
MALEKFSLKDKVALVTGGSRGIGKAIALGFAEAGADVVVSSRKLEDLEKVAKEIEEKGRKSLALACHIGRKEEIEALVERVVKELGRIDILVNNAATNPVFGPILDIEERAWDKIMEVNLKGYFFVSLAVGRVMMKQKGGSIINLASTAGIKPSPMLGAYSISKAGVIMLTKVLATEWAAFNIRVNALAPGLVETRFSKALWGNPEILKEALKDVPLGRVAQPEEMVGAALYLASEAGSYVTGETLVLNG